MGGVFPHNYLQYVKPLDFITESKPTSRLDLESGHIGVAQRVPITADGPTLS